MSLVFATTFFFVFLFLFFFGGGGGGYFVTRLSRPILSSKFLDPWLDMIASSFIMFLCVLAGVCQPHHVVCHRKN